MVDHHDISEPRKRPPATTPEQRENQLVALAVDLAEEQLRSGKASSQVITHYLKLATPREDLERDKIRLENELLKVKAEAVESGKRTEELYGNALKAMRQYGGLEMPDDDENT